MGLLPDDALDLTAAEVDGDGVVSVSDALLILRCSMDLIGEFPIEQQY